MLFRQFLKEGKEVEQDEKELPTTRFEEEVLGLEKKFVAEEEEEKEEVDEEKEEELEEGSIVDPDEEEEEVVDKKVDDKVNDTVDDKEELDEGSHPPGIKVTPMTDDDLNPEGTPATENPVDEEVDKDKEEITESEVVDEDIKDAEVRDLSDEEVNDLLDAIARTDDEKKEIKKEQR